MAIDPTDVTGRYTVEFSNYTDGGGKGVRVARAYVNGERVMTCEGGTEPYRRLVAVPGAIDAAVGLERAHMASKIKGPR